MHDRLPYINHFYIIKHQFQTLHTANTMLVFQYPCIGYLLKGTGEFLYKSKQYFASVGDLIYIAKGTRYFSIWRGEPEIEFYSLNYGFANQYKDDFAFQILRNYPRDGLDKIYQEYEKGSMKSLGHLYFFLDTLYEKLQKNTQSHEQNHILPAIDYIEQHYTEKIYIDQLAHLCSLSPSRFFTVFKDVTGSTPIRYKNAMRIQRGMELLYDTELTIEEISEQLNYSSVAQFRKQFKLLTGITPKTLRKQE